MRSLALVLFATAFSLNVFAQDELATEPYYKNGKITFQNVREIDGLSKHDLFFGTVSWINSTFKSADDVIVTEDKEAGKIIAKGAFNVHTNRMKSGQVYFTFRIEFKEARYRYTFSDFRYKFKDGYTDINQPLEAGKPRNFSRAWWRDAHEDVVDKMIFLPDELYMYLRDYESDSDW